MRYRFMLMLLAIAGVTGCAAVPDHARSLQVNLGGIELAAPAGPVWLQLTVSNQGDSVMPVASLRYRVAINGVEYTSGISRQAVNIPSHGEAVFEVMVSDRLPLPAGQTRISYNLSGVVRLADGQGELTFVNEGVLNWRDGAGA